MRRRLFSALLLSLSCISYANTSEKIRLGAIFPMTGNIASYGQDNVNALKLYIEKVNATNGILGKKIELILEDSRGEPTDAINSLNKLTGVDKVEILLGTPSSSNTLAIAPLAQEKKVTLLSPSGTSSKIPEAGDYVGHVCFTDEYQAETMAAYAYKKLAKRKIIIIEDQSSDYSKGLSEAFRKMFVTLGGTIVDDNLKYQQKDIDFRSLLLKVRRSAPDAVYIPGYYTEAALIIKQARQMGLKMTMLGADGFDSPFFNKIGGSSLDNVFFTTHFAVDDHDPIVQTFVTDYKKKYNELPSAQAALAYDAIGMIHFAIENQPKPFENFHQKLFSVKNFKGVTGTISFLPDRNVAKDATIIKIEKNKNSFVEKYSAISPTLTTSTNKTLLPTK